jgi:hypothetical protein
MGSWDFEFDDLATTIADEQGCVTSGWRPPGLAFRGVAFKQGYIPAFGTLVSPSVDPGSLSFSTLTTSNLSLLPVLAGARGPAPGTQQDLRHSIFWAFSVCEQSERVTGSPTAFCLGHGIVGARVELSPPVGLRVYVNEQGLPQSDVPSVTKNAVVTFWDLPPGEYTAHVLPPDSAPGIDCSAAQQGTDGLTAWPGAGPNEFKLRAEAGSLHGSWVFCTLTQ